ncbi:MAG: aspartate carbamoyltransferase regulatory subunit [Candidatus Bathyarchaeia archaeon]
MSGGEELRIRKIEEGTVIDHIPAGYALAVLRILGITGREGMEVSVAMNVPSLKLGRKDIVKIEKKELRPQEVDKIALIAPRATINIIKGYAVHEKQRVKLPPSIVNVVRCANPACISNSREPIKPTFRVKSDEPLLLECHYCHRVMEKEDVVKQF